MKYFTLIVTVLFITSCSPTLHYLGETYQPTIIVDTYYSPEDIKKDFKVIGQLENGGEIPFNIDRIRTAMIEEAQKRGADAILFLRSDSFDGRHKIEADLLRYE